jgi:integrase
MKIDPPPPITTVVTLQPVLDRVAANPELTPTRKRDLASAVRIYAKLVGQPPAAIPLDLSAIRQHLDRMVPARAAISPKRWANLRSDLAAAIAASGLQPILTTAGVGLDAAWRPLMATAPKWVRVALSRLARWSSLYGIAPEAIDDHAIDRFIAELHSSTLVGKLRYRSGLVRRAWNALAAQHPNRLRPVTLKPNKRVLKRIPWEQFPASLQRDVINYVDWASVPDALDEGARARALSPQTLRLQQEHIHSAASAAVEAGIDIEQLTSLANLVHPETCRAILRRRRQGDGGKPTAYAHGIAITLIAIASEWVQASPETVAILKALRRKLGALPPGLTEKNKALLRTLEDPRLLTALMQLPDRMWHAARRAQTYRSFGDLQTALAIDILTHVPMRMQNLAPLQFGVHLHWPQGRRKPALVVLRPHETKTRIELNYELPATLADRLQVYRNEIAPAVLAKRPDTLFFTREGRRRSQPAIANAIYKAILRHVGIRMTPHQFRHLCGQIILIHNPGAHELVRQMLGHTSVRTTTSFYAGFDTRRAGRAHAELVMQLRESKLRRRRPRSTLEPL